MVVPPRARLLAGRLRRIGVSLGKADASGSSLPIGLALCAIYLLTACYSPAPTPEPVPNIAVSGNALVGGACSSALDCGANEQCPVSTCVCAPGFYGNAGASCSACDSSCATCTGPTADDCTSCGMGATMAPNVGYACSADAQCAVLSVRNSSSGVCTTGACALSSCQADYYVNGSVCTACAACGPGSYESTACAGSTNRVCTVLTTCTASEYESSAATATTDRVCTALSTCTGSQYESAAATSTSDRGCTALTMCTGSEYESTAATSTSDRVCTALTMCTGSEYESTAATATTDRACTALTTCTASEYESTAATSTSDRACTALTTCTASEYESTAATATTDRVCTGLTTCTGS